LESFDAASAWGDREADLIADASGLLFEIDDHRAARA
jgi:hypothetical protein